MQTVKKALPVLLAILLVFAYRVYRQPVHKLPVVTAVTPERVPQNNGGDLTGNPDPLSSLAVPVPVNRKRPLTAKERYLAFLKRHPFYLKAYENQGGNAKEMRKEREGNKEGEEGENPRGAWEQDFLRTMDPNLKRPTPEVLPDVIRRNHALNLPGKKLDGIPGTSSAPWVERGPNNVGGRTRALVWDPNDGTGKKVWAGGVTGGLWYNNDITDPNSSWTKVDDFWGNIAVCALAFDPNNPQVVYAGTGEGFYARSSLGAGIWKSTNGGGTWTQLSATTAFNNITDIVVRNESGSSVVYAGVDGVSYQGSFFNPENAGLHRSTNGGTSWAQVLPNIPGTTIHYVAASVKLDAGNKIWVGTKGSPYAATDRGGGRILNSSNGTSWTVSEAVGVTNGYGRVTVACAPSDANYVYAFIENEDKLSSLRKTTNGGSSWTSFIKPVDADNDIPATDFTRSQAFYDQAMAVDPNDPNTLLIGAVDIFKSINGGTNWLQITKWSNNNALGALTCSQVHADQHVILYKPGSSSTAIFGNDGGVYYTSSVTTAATANVMSSRNKNYNVTQFYAAAMHPAAGSNSYLAGAQDNGTQKFSSAGVNATTESTGGDGSYCFIDQTNPLYQITGYVHNIFNFSTDGGATYPTDLINDDVTGSFINPACYDNNLHIFYSYKSVKNLYRVKNITTTPVLSTLTLNDVDDVVTSFKVSPYTTASSTLFIGTLSGNLYKVLNADGSTPVVLDIGSALPPGAISCIELGSSENELLVTFFNYGVNKIWYSSNGGSAWVDKSGNYPNIPARWALFNPNNRANEVILATELGIYSTANFSNAAPTWVASNTGFANVRTDMLQLRSSDNQVVAATFGRGLFSSDAFGSTVPAPVITSFTPTSAATGAPVTITGTNLTGASLVSFGGTAAASFSVLSSTTVRAVVASGSTGNVNVTTPAGTANLTGFTYIVGPPTITSFTPVDAGVGTVITITGTNLTGTTSVTFGGTQAASFTVGTATSLVAIVGTGSTGSLSVTTSVGSGNKSGFTFFAQPTVTAFSPTTSTTGGIVTATGTNFTGAIAVSLGNTPAAAFTVTSATGITIAVGPGSTGDLNVTTPGGTGTKTGFTFIAGPPPVITSFSPTAGAPGTTVTITGSNFNATASNNIVYFGAVKAVVTTASTTALTVIVPVGTTYQPISVVDKATTLIAYSAAPFNITFTSLNAINTKDFTAKVDFTTSPNPNGIALGDIDGDGKMDLVVTNTNDNTISLFRNTSVTGTVTSASFATPVNFATGFRPNNVAIGDLDGDGKPDIAVSTLNSTTVTLYRNTASPGAITTSSLAAKVECSVGFTGSRFVAISDMDKDGKPDLVITNSTRYTVSVLRSVTAPGNITTSSFLGPIDFATGSNPVTIAIGDIDGDGKADIAVANSFGSTISLFRNTSVKGIISSSSFAAKVDLSLARLSPLGVALSDLDGNGKLDVVAAMYNTGNNVNVFPNTSTSGSFTFGTRIDMTTGTLPNPWLVQVSDLDGDGKPDIATSNPIGNSISIFRNVGTSGLTSASFFSNRDLVTGLTPYGFAIGDLDGDGKPDIAGLNTGANSISVLRNDPQFPPAITSFTPTSAGQGTTITITGTGFTGATAVTLGGSSVTSFSVLSSTTVSAVAGFGATGSVSVTNANGTGTLAGFTFIPPPTITAFSPSTATTGSVISMTGTNFNNVLSVSFGGTAATAFTVVSATNIMAAVGAGASGNVTVTTPGGVTSRGTLVFVPPPTISSFTPVNAGAGATITITGTNLTGALTVTFGGTAAASFSVLSSTTIIAAVGSGATGNVSVSNTLTTATLGGFSFYPTPTLSAFSPQSSATGGVISITGTNLTGILTVTFGGTSASSFTVNSATNISATVGAGATGSLAVSNPGVSASITGFTYCPSPLVNTGGPVTFCIGGNVVLTSNAASGNQWYKDGSAIGGATSASYTATASGLYTVGITSANNCFATSAAVTVTVNAFPAVPVITAGGAITFCAGANVVLTSAAATTYQWFKDGTAISGSTAQSYTANAGGTYTVTVTNAGNCSATSAGTAVTVNALPAVPAISAGGTLVFCDTGRVVLTSGTATGNQWSRDGVAITGATNATYTATQTGSYTVTATNAGNCSATSVATVITVNAIPGKPDISRSNADLVSSITAGNQWYNDASILAGATARNYRPSLSGYYKVQATNAGCTGLMSNAYYYLVTGIYNISGSNIGSYRLLPNPATEKLVIQSADPTDKIAVVLLDANGRMVLRKEFTVSTIIDMGFMAPGMYTVLLTDTRTRKQESKQIIKQ